MPGPKLPTLLPALLLALALPALAQSSSPVASAPPAALPEPRDAALVLEAFTRTYAQAGKPRIALFWNRELGDQVETGQREVARVSGSRDSAGFSIIASRGTETDKPEPRRTTLAERELWQVETAFSQRLLDAGVFLVDRAAILRLTAGTARQSSDAQQLEVSALTGKADLLLEVLMTADAEAPLGWGFRANLKDIKTGRVMGTSYLKALPDMPPPAQPTYRARPGGFDLVPPPPVAISVQAVGATLALDSMRDLTRRLAAR